MFKKKLAVAILGALMFSPAILPQNNFVPASVVCAEVKTIEADGYYIMGDGTEENQGVAKERARENAKRAASEQACTFVESLSEVKDGNLTRDEIRTFSASVMQVISAPITPEVAGDSIRFHCHITVKVDENNVTERLKKDRQKIEELTKLNQNQADEIARLNAEIEALKEKYKTATAEERTEINAEVKRNEEQFTSAQWADKAVECIYSSDYEKAIEYSNNALELDSKNFDALLCMAFAYENLNNYDKTIEYYNKALELKPNSTVIYNNLANLYYNELNDKDKAIDYLNKAIELDSNDAFAWANLAITYNKSKNYQKAIEYANKAVDYRLDVAGGFLF